ncbi:hypothetical protein TNCV_2963771 [Trichonephila clavipes]|nr:hypothetical protein TNCV_2963771 [Trichonephila clavipes]
MSVEAKWSWLRTPGRHSFCRVLELLKTHRVEDIRFNVAQCPHVGLVRKLNEWRDISSVAFVLVHNYEDLRQ